MITISNKTEKPKKTSHEIISRLKTEKDITFKYISEVEAEEYLCTRNNYLRTASYRKNYLKHTAGPSTGKYINLDFAYLVELSTIDMHLRFLISKMCLDVEHAMKVILIHHLETNMKSDGYDVVKDFLNMPKYSYILTEIERKSASTFTGDLIKKYFSLKYSIDPHNGKPVVTVLDIDCPMWVFMEIISFGALMKFYDFYCHRYKVTAISYSILNSVRSLRNACAHNNCVICNLQAGTSYAPPEITKWVASISSITKSQRGKKLSCRPILEFVCLLYVYDKVVSEKVKYHRGIELKELFHERITEKRNYFVNNELLKTSYDFLVKMIDNKL